MAALAHLFAPLDIRGMHLPNRTVMPSMVTNYATTDGCVTQRLVDYFVARARGGVGLILTEAAYVRADGKGFPNELGIYSDKLIPGLRDLADAVHEADGRIGVQLYHGGRQTATIVTGLPTVAPSAIPDPTIKQIPHAMSMQEIESVQQAFVDAARRARTAGFDAVELHGAHGYLLAAFLSPFSNRRTDRYGGSIQGRAQFAVEIVQRVRAEVGEDFPILFRISAEERVEGGLTLDQTRIIARLLEQAGVDCIDVSVGNYATPGGFITGGMDLERGLLVGLAAEIKSAVSVPVIAVGRLNDPLLAEEVIASNSADLVAVGRGLLADAEWVRKSEQGAYADIRPCIACNEGCIALLLAGQPVECVMNPTCGREGTLAPAPAETAKEVVVVGGGPAGLEASRVLAIRGHHVRLFEKSPELGGEFRVAAMVPRKEEIADGLRWQIAQVEALGVDIKLGTPATDELIESVHPDAVVVATGAQPAMAEIPGLDTERTVPARDVLLGQAPTGDRVVVVGGGAVGLEVAEYLAVQRKQVTVLEALDTVGEGMEANHLYWVMESLRQHGVTTHTGVMIESVERDATIRTRSERGVETLGPFDSVVLATGYQADDGLYQRIKDRLPDVHLIGDAIRPRTALEAMRDAAEVAQAI